MATPTEEVNQELFHYTNIFGLEGIIKSQTLWATHPAFLNDATELKAFRERLPGIFRPSVEKAVAELRKAPGNQEMIEQEWGTTKAAENLATAIAKAIYYALLGTHDTEAFADPYILSFCTVGRNDEIARHGLLSQWRGYGQEGGYAIVFDRRRLVKLLEEERDKWRGYELFCDDVAYSMSDDKKIREELGSDLNILEENFFEYIVAGTRQTMANLFLPVLKCACRYKHSGFHEEKEVRIVAILPSKEQTETEKARGILANDKPRKHFVRAGTAVPCIHLFEGITTLPENPLPIKRIIVGPHRDKDRTIQGVKSLLGQYRLNVPVLNSEIPYVGHS